MMRRVLLPFSELFILLALMFLVLFFVSAALGGRGEERPSDTLHLVDISWEMKRGEWRRENFEFGNLWLAKSPFFASASTLADAQDGAWFLTWAMDSLNHNVFNWQAFSDDEVCTPLQADVNSGMIKQWDRPNHPNLTLTPIPQMLPPKSFQILTGGNGSLITASTRNIESVGIHFTENDDTIFTFTSGLSLAYRPEDIGRSIVIEAGVLIPLNSQTDDVVRQDFTESRIVFRHGTATGDARQTILTLFTGHLKRAFWHADDQSASILSAPVYYSNKACKSDDPFMSIRLFVTLTPKGATASLYDPRIVR